MSKFRRLRRGVLVGATVLGSTGIALATAGTASATVVSAANNTIIGSGGNTPYNVMASLALLFNGSEGCNPIVPSSQTEPLTFTCPSGGSLPAGNPPFGYGAPSVGSGYSENPTNDVVEVEPGIGSSAGITQLENQGSHTTSTAPINFASSARGPNTGQGGKYDDQGLNFVEYAEDGVDWVAYTEYPKGKKSKASPASTVTNLTQTQLQDIWEGTDKCWSDVGATGKEADALIDPYSVVTSSAVTTTWDSFLSPDNSETYVDSQTAWPPATLPTCNNGQKAIYLGTQDFTNYETSHTVVQNEVADIVKNGDQGDAIIFMSVGRYDQQKKSVSFANTELGDIGGQTPNEKSVLNGSWPVPEGLYTAYSNGTNSDIPVSSAPTLNYASEDGFLCKPNTSNGLASGTQIVDPATGSTFRSEIETAITSNGFFPLDGNNENVPFEEGNVDTPADSISSFTGSSYYQYDTPPTAGSPAEQVGYCLVFTTDGNTGHD